LKRRADFGNGGEGWLVGTGEATERKTFCARVVHFDIIALDAGRDEAGGDGRIAGAVGVVFAVDGEVERIKRVRLAVDFDGVGSVHRFMRR